jgi:hypothetical protein
MSIFFSIYFAIGLLYFLILFYPDEEDPDDLIKYLKKRINENGSRTVGLAFMIILILFLATWPIALAYDIFDRIRNLFKKKEEDNNAECR